VEKKKESVKKAEKEDDSNTEEEKPAAEKPEKKQKLTQKKKSKKAKKAKKSKKSEKKDKEAEKSEEEDAADDIMEKFEESLGEDGAGPWKSLHQKESKKDASAPVVAASLKKSNSDDFDHALKKKSGPKEQKNEAKGLSYDEEDRMLEKKLQSLKKLLNV